ncbi:putative quinol monooxygenase [Paenibacillus sp. CAU 1782]
MLIIHAHLQIIPEQEDAFHEAARALIPLSRAEEGNAGYQLLKNTEVPHRYTMVELWRDQEAVALHNASSHLQAFIKQAPDFMAAPMELQAFTGEPVNKA